MYDIKFQYLKINFRNTSNFNQQCGEMTRQPTKRDGKRCTDKSSHNYGHPNITYSWQKKQKKKEYKLLTCNVPGCTLKVKKTMNTRIRNELNLFNSTN